MLRTYYLGFDCSPTSGIQIFCLKFAPIPILRKLIAIPSGNHQHSHDFPPLPSAMSQNGSLGVSPTR
jgi:hypothetical protein